jgi:hypothetical protein
MRWCPSGGAGNAPALRHRRRSCRSLPFHRLGEHSGGETVRAHSDSCPGSEALLADEPGMEVASIEAEPRHDNLALGVAHEKQPEDQGVEVS